MAQAPYMVSIGNHERDWPHSGDWFPGRMHDSGGECGVAHERRFLMPSSEQDTPWCAPSATMPTDTGPWGPSD